MKDALGHGSNTGTKGMRLVKTHVLGPHSAKVYKNPEWGENVVKFFNGVYQSKADSHTDDLADAHSTAQFQLKRYADQDAKAALASGPKSAPVPTHDSMTDDQWGSHNAMYGSRASDETPARKGYNEHGSRHGYNPDSVNKAIDASNRGGQRIGRKQASAIHRLLKGR